MQRKNYSSLSLILILSSIIIIYIAKADIHSVVSNIFTLDTREGELIPLEHSALSNIFILDTQEVPLAKDLKHSALSNIFTLDTRKLTLKVVELDSNPNPEISQAMEGSATYQYYRVVDNNGKGVSDMKPVLEINISHPLMQHLQATGLEESRVCDWAHILFDQALLSEGGQLEDPAGFVHRLNDMFLEITTASNARE